MRIRWNATFVSALLFSLALVALVPSSLEAASTWRAVNWVYGHRGLEPNFTAPIGFCRLGFETVGLIVLWTGYRRNVRWTWFVMLLMISLWFVPTSVLPTLQRIHGLPSWCLRRTQEQPLFSWSEWLRAAVNGERLFRAEAEDLADFLLMVVALLLPMKAFFSRRAERVKSGWPWRAIVMKLRFSTSLVSVWLFSLALIASIPWSLNDVSTWRYLYWEYGYRGVEPNFLAPIGFCSLGFEAIGLVVLWAGYRKNVRWTWFVMLAISSLWYFAAVVLPWLQEFAVSSLLRAAVRGDHLARDAARVLAVLLLMVIALLLPLKAFFFQRSGSPQPDAIEKSGGT